ncbi:hypothetical protein H0H92_005566 [Tricholoma furcatifolium]|nr:hypothetical protein H0H92_005566 [Tricholoma furcatifolium]
MLQQQTPIELQLKVQWLTSITTWFVQIQPDEMCRQVNSMSLREAKARLASTAEALKSAEEAKAAILVSPPKKHGGGVARKHKVLADYDLALQAYKDCQTEVALTQNNSGAPPNPSETMNVGDGADGAPQMASDIHMDTEEETEITIGVDHLLDTEMEGEDHFDNQLEGEDHLDTQMEGEDQIGEEISINAQDLVQFSAANAEGVTYGMYNFTAYDNDDIDGTNEVDRDGEGFEVGNGNAVLPGDEDGEYIPEDEDLDVEKDADEHDVTSADVDCLLTMDKLPETAMVGNEARAKAGKAKRVKKEKKDKALSSAPRENAASKAPVFCSLGVIRGEMGLRPR